MPLTLVLVSALPVIAVVVLFGALSLVGLLTSADPAPPRAQPHRPGRRSPLAATTYQTSPADNRASRP